MNMIKRLTSYVLAAVLFILIALTLYLIASPSRGESFTEFYILGPEGKAYDYPTNITLGENGTLLIGVVNHEYGRMDYILKTLLDNVTLGEENLRLEHNESYMGQLTFTPTQHSLQRLDLILYKKTEDEPYRTLHLWVEVRGY